jgi:fructose-specific phosphotransferase system IIC component
MIWWALASAVLTILVALLRRAKVIPPGLLAVTALIPVVVMAGFFVALARYLRSIDELQRLIHLEALLFQFGATALLVMGYGSLAHVGALPTLEISDAMSAVWIGTFLMYGLGYVLVSRKYQ